MSRITLAERSANERRNAKIRRLHEKGFKLYQIAACFGLSAPRIHQILKGRHDEQQRPGEAARVE